MVGATFQGHRGQSSKQITGFIHDLEILGCHGILENVVQISWNSNELKIKKFIVFIVFFYKPIFKKSLTADRAVFHL
jgi:hypothetical protein